MRRNWTAPIIALVISILVVGGAFCVKNGVFEDFTWPWEKSEPASGWNQWVDYHYFNNDLLGTAHPHHFGPDRYALFAQTRTDEQAGKYSSESEYLAYWTRNNFYNSIEVDPMLAAGCIYYAQKVTGENFLGDLQGDTDEVRANYAHYLMRSSPEYWKTTVQKFEKYLDKNFGFMVVDINGEYVASSYQLPRAATFDSSAPRMVWEDSRSRDGHWLQFMRLSGKDSTDALVLRYRMECGYQFPTEQFTSGGKDPDVPPIDPQPTPTPGPVPTNPPQPTPPPGPTPTPAPYNKDPQENPIFNGNAEHGGVDWFQPATDLQPTEPPVAQDTIIYGSPESGPRGTGGRQAQDAYPDTTPGTRTTTETTTSGGTTTVKKETTTTSIDQGGTVVRDITTEVTVTDPQGHTTTVTETERKFDSCLVDHVDTHASQATDSSGQTVVVGGGSVSDGEIFIP